MLGQGLESLIPPQNSGSGDDGQVPKDDHSGGDAGYPLHPQGITDPPRQNTPSTSDAPPAVPFVAEEPVAEPPVLLPDIAPLGSQSESLSQPKAEQQIPFSPNQPGLDSSRRGGRGEPVAEKQKKLIQESIFHIEVSKISPNPNQPRRKFPEQGIRELAYSIREFGFLQPLVVSKTDKETPQGVEVDYQLIAGERRLLAAKLLGLETVPAIVRAVDLEREKLEMAVIENIQREDLSQIETARAFTRLQEEFRMTQREIAAKLGKSREVVANTVRLLDLPIYIQEALEKGQIMGSHARLLLTISDPAAQLKLFNDIMANNLTTRELRQRVEVLKPRRHRQQEELSPELKMFEEKLSTELGTPVKIERGLNTGTSTGLSAGKITITFFSEEELENIVRKIGREPDFH